MLRYLGKIELKRSFIQYSMLFLFFIFWNFYLLTFFFLFVNTQKFLSFYKNYLWADILVYEKNSETIKKLTTELKNFEYVKNLKIFPPEELYQKTKFELPSALFSEEEILSVFPYVIRVYVYSVKNLYSLKKYINFLSSLNPSIKLISEKPLKIFHLGSIFSKIFYILIFVWFTFYFFFLYLINQSLNEALKDQTQTFLLLGGGAFKLKLLRNFFFISILFIACIISSLCYFSFAKYMHLIFNFFEIYPDFSKSEHLYYFLVYISFVIILIPVITVHLSYKKYEI